MPMGDPLAKGDLQGQPAREVAFYGGVRQSWEQARAGLEGVVQHLDELFQRDPQNVRLQRYIAQVQKLLAKAHKLQMRSSRVRDRLTQPRNPSPQPAGNFLQSAPGGAVARRSR